MSSQQDIPVAKTRRHFIVVVESFFLSVEEDFRTEKNNLSLIVEAVFCFNFFRTRQRQMAQKTPLTLDSDLSIV